MPSFSFFLLCFGLLSLFCSKQALALGQETPSITLPNNSEDYTLKRKHHEPQSSLQIDDLLGLNFLMAESYYYGEWMIQDFSNKLGFTKKQGICQFYCQTDSACVFTLHIYDGVYRNEPNLYLHYPFDVKQKERHAFNQTNSTLSYDHIQVQIIRSLDSHSESERCQTKTNVYFVNTTSKIPFIPSDTGKDRQHFGIQLEIISEDYNFHLITSIMTSNNKVFDSQILTYIIIMALYGLLEGGTCIYLYKKFQHRPALTRRISQGTLALVNAFDFFLAFFHIFEFMNPISLYALISMLNAIVAFFIMPPLIWEVIVTKIKRTTPRYKARAITSSYFWMLSIVVIPLISMSVNEDIVYYASILVFVPQILDNFASNIKYQWNPLIIFCLVLPKFLFTVYIRGDEQNLFRYRPNYTLVLTSIIALALQFLLLLLQTKWPRFGYEPKSPYTRIPAKEVQTKGDVCPVCLEELKKMSVNDDNLEKPLLEELNKRKQMIITPCQHKFHEVCLEKWLKKKSECPNCRQELPDLMSPDEMDDELSH